jgi:1-hydroxycarotenoid 3,4-desaturase
MSRTPRVIVVGAGIGGLATALELAARGLDVQVLERAAAPGGKMREVPVDGAAVDGGPTVFTMRWIFEGLLQAAGTSLEAELDLVPATVLARHAWRAGGRLDLFADVARSAEAIGDFAGAADARGYLDFCRRSAAVYRTLQDTFIARSRPSLPELVRRVGLRRLDELWNLGSMRSLWSALGGHFRDPRLRQLFARYATYCGSSPLTAPATLMLVAHVEQDGVWLVRGGMRRVADALQRIGESQGARYRFGAQVATLQVERGRIAGVTLADGEALAADAVVFNGDVSALSAGLLGGAVRDAAPGTAPRDRSLSATTWCVHARTAGFPLEHHNVFFAEDYPREFQAIFGARTVVDSPTVYVCAQDRGAAAAAPVDGARERLLVLVNAPPDGDRAAFDAAWTEARRRAAFGLLEACGLEVDGHGRDGVATTPAGFERLFPASGGALYGRASVGPFATFRRSGATTRVPGLYLAGGSVHPGPGIPMAAMSGRLAAAAVLQELGASRTPARAATAPA